VPGPIPRHQPQHDLREAFAKLDVKNTDNNNNNNTATAPTGTDGERKIYPDRPEDVGAGVVLGVKRPSRNREGGVVFELEG